MWPAVVGLPIDFCSDAPLRKGLHERLVDGAIGPQAAGGQRVTLGDGQAVGHFQIVQNGAAAAAAPHGRATAAGRVLAAIGVRLKVAQRQRRLLPAIQSQPAVPLDAASSNSALLTAMFQAPPAGGLTSRRKDEE